MCAGIELTCDLNRPADGHHLDHLGDALTVSRSVS